MSEWLTRMHAVVTALTFDLSPKRKQFICGLKAVLSGIQQSLETL